MRVAALMLILIVMPLVAVNTSADNVYVVRVRDKAEVSFAVLEQYGLAGQGYYVLPAMLTSDGNLLVKYELNGVYYSWIYVGLPNTVRVAVHNWAGGLSAVDCYAPQHAEIREIRGSGASACYITLELPLDKNRQLHLVELVFRPGGVTRVEVRVDGSDTGVYLDLKGSSFRLLEAIASSGVTVGVNHTYNLRVLEVVSPATLLLPFPALEPRYAGGLEFRVWTQDSEAKIVDVKEEYNGVFYVVTLWFDAPPRKTTAVAPNPDAVSCTYADMDGDGEPEVLCQPVPGEPPFITRVVDVPYEVLLEAYDRATGQLVARLELDLGLQPQLHRRGDERLLLAGLGLAAVVIIFMLARGGRR